MTYKPLVYQPLITPLFFSCWISSGDEETSYNILSLLQMQLTIIENMMNKDFIRRVQLLDHCRVALECFLLTLECNNTHSGATLNEFAKVLFELEMRNCKLFYIAFDLIIFRNIWQVFIFKIIFGRLLSIVNCVLI